MNIVLPDNPSHEEGDREALSRFFPVVGDDLRNLSNTPADYTH